MIDIDSGRGNLIRGRDLVTGQEFLGVLREHLQQDPGKFSQYLYSLVDLTEVTEVDIDGNQVKAVAKMSADALPANPDAVVAFVTARPVVYGLTRMWQLTQQARQWESRIFDDLEDAKAWLRTGVALRFGVTDIGFSLPPAVPSRTKELPIS